MYTGRRLLFAEISAFELVMAAVSGSHIFHNSAHPLAAIAAGTFPSLLRHMSICHRLLVASVTVVSGQCHRSKEAVSAEQSHWLQLWQSTCATWFPPLKERHTRTVSWMADRPYWPHW